MQEFRPELDEENYLGRDCVDRSPAAPVHRIDADLQMNEARCEWRRHAVGDATIAFAVAAGDQRRAFGRIERAPRGQGLVFAALVLFLGRDSRVGETE